VRSGHARPALISLLSLSMISDVAAANTAIGAAINASAPELIVEIGPIGDQAAGESDKIAASSRNPTTGIAGCCARAASGHAAAAPPSSDRNERRFHWWNRIRCPQAVRAGPQDTESGRISPPSDFASSRSPMTISWVSLWVARSSGPKAK